MSSVACSATMAVSSALGGLGAAPAQPHRMVDVTTPGSDQARHVRTSARGTSGSSVMNGSWGAVTLHISPDMPGSRMRQARRHGLGLLADSGRGGDAPAATEGAACRGHA